MLWLGPLLEPLPRCTLGTIILMSLRSMFLQIIELKTLWPISKIDFAIWLISFLATVCIDVMYGLGVSIIVALLTIVFRSQWPSWRYLAELPNTPYFEDHLRYSAAISEENICVVQFESPVLFPNVEKFKRAVHLAAKEYHEKKMKNVRSASVCIASNKVQPIYQKPDKENPEWVGQSKFLIIDCAGISFIDCMGVNAFREIVEEMQEEDITVIFSRVNIGIRDILDKSGFFSDIPKSIFFHRVKDAVDYIRILAGSVSP
ncbi:hypothetical protein AB6A40_004999 [Gnathostoma spinigerum]|uniref:STAS domain-containing protein n=1 Tax=Gnathostoma spinigerum TaxID=75299 RepID=A0ABD6EE49_9BILA